MRTVGGGLSGAVANCMLGLQREKRKIAANPSVSDMHGFQSA